MKNFKYQKAASTFNLLDKYDFSFDQMTGFCAIETDRKDKNGFFFVTTVLHTPHGRYLLESYINPEMLSDSESNSIMALTSSCYEAYQKDIKRARI